MAKGFGVFRKLSFLITFLGFALSAVYLRNAVRDYNKFKNSVPSTCMVVGFYTDESRNITCTFCRFIIQFDVPDSAQRLIIPNWSPEFHTTYGDGVTVKPKHPAFSCCPTSGNFDCCKFLDPDSDEFCDNWGNQEPTCPLAPWPCFVENLNSYIETGVTPWYHLNSYMRVIVEDGYCFSLLDVALA